MTRITLHRETLAALATRGWLAGRRALRDVPDQLPTTALNELLPTLGVLDVNALTSRQWARALRVYNDAWLRGAAARREQAALDARMAR